MLAGSPGYQSPGQLRAESTRPPSDVYAFGGGCLITYVSEPLLPRLGMFQIIQKVTNNIEPNTDLLQQYKQGRVKQICDNCFDNVSVRPSSVQVLEELLHTAHDYAPSTQNLESCISYRMNPKLIMFLFKNVIKLLFTHHP